MKDTEIMLQTILRENPAVHAAWFDDIDDPHTLTLATRHGFAARNLTLPRDLARVAVRTIPTRPLETLRAPALGARAANPNQQCQNEPIHLGCQIQPSGANWLGTAGAPVSFTDTKGKRCWGFLTNWHVLADGDQRIGRPAHQPDTNRPAIGHLARWSEVKDDEQNLVDCAVADCIINGLHTISNRILDIGEIGSTPLNARIGLAVAKAGRTTGLTTGTCIGTAAAVSVGYGDFTARFIDQDIFTADSGEFSAPGDSGSMIVGRSCKCPTALLFAGSDTITIGNPIRHVAATMSLIFPFN